VFAIFGIEIDECRKCKGIWLDRDELRILKDKSERDSWGTLRWLDDEVDAIDTMKALPSNLHCPKCSDTLLVSVGFGESEVIINWCPSCCGTWLDQQEY
jgi:Zn-finger nucleic acid-binding protein